MKETILKASKISKSYSGIPVLQNVDFLLKAGEVHALLGENGAGKSTFIKIISGTLDKDSGKTEIFGTAREIKNAHFARQLGIGTVFQELSLIPSLSVAENVFLGKEDDYSKVVLSRQKFIEHTRSLLDEFEININPKESVGNLSAAQRQLVEIIKAISHNPKILILDEPTSTLTEKEAQTLFRLINNMKSNGTGIIYISHRMNEIFEITDQVTILRDGAVITSCAITELCLNDIIKHMVGREIEIYERERSSGLTSHNQKKRLEVKNLSKSGYFNDVSFDLYEGEILGIAGLVGSGRSELMKSIFGLLPYDSGSIRIQGQHVTIKKVKDALRNKIALLPESRHHEGLVLNHDIEKNIALPILNKFTRFKTMNYKEIKKFVIENIAKYGIKPANPKMIVKKLSGGNQQKVCIVKWLSTDPSILILDEPTVGIDVRTKSEIHAMIGDLSKMGLSIIMVSSEMPELLAHSDRIIVMNKGTLINSYTAEEASQEKIMSDIVNDNLKKKEVVV